MARKPQKRKAPPRRKVANQPWLSWAQIWPWLIGLVPIGLIATFILTGAATRLANSIQTDFASYTARHGFTVQNIQLLGRHEIDSAIIMDAVQVTRGDPLLAVRPDDIRKRLENLTWIKSARVERRLPATLYIKIEERYPIALWQAQQKLHLIDRSGVLLGDQDLDKFKQLPILIGDDAPKNIAPLMSALDHYPDLKLQIKAATFVGDRRWDLQLRDNTVVKLPEAAPDDGIKRLMDFDAAHNVLANPVRTIDLRLPDRVVIQPLPDAAPEAVPTKNTKKQQI